MKRQLVAAAVAAWSVVGAAQSERTGAPAFSFTPREIATGVRFGYHTIAVDLNKDGRPDVVSVASNDPELAWYENPTWTRHVLASGFAGLINVAAADVDGDGIPELAVGAWFSTRPEVSQGLVFLLTHGADVTQRWSVREIDRVPTAHRLRWYSADRGEQILIVGPLGGATSQLPDYKGATPIYYYRAPDWKRGLVSDAEQGVLHGIEPAKWDGIPGEVLLSAGFMGIHRYQYAGGRWQRTQVTAGDPAPWPKGGSSDVNVGHLGAAQFVAAIEPWHGNEVVIYRDQQGRLERQVVDTELTNGHTLVTADLDGDGRDEVIAGQTQGKRAVWIYTAGSKGDTWSRSTLDDAMAASACAAADFNADRKIDLVCISGTALKWYENTTRR